VILKYLKYFVIVLGCVAGGILVGRYELPAQGCSIEVDCMLEESKAIEGCEYTASFLEQELRQCSRKESWQDEQIELWKLRANHCASLLGELHSRCDN
jgi:hypothetical protein